MMTMWTATANKESLNPFATFLEKDVASKGDFETDFTSFCTQNNIIRCPAVITSSSDLTELRISDAMIDISNWRAMLLAVCCTGAKIRQMRIHNCLLTTQHVKDLASALVKSAAIKVVRLQYCNLGIDSTNQGEYIEAFKSLLNDQNQVECFSFKGSGITDDIVTGFSPALQINYKITSLNLSTNLIGDASIDSISQAIRFVGSYKAFSFADNQITAVGVKSMFNLFLGTPSSPKDEGDMKAITKSVTDKNKALKDINKKRKKAGAVELSEYAPMPECIKTIDGKPWISNYHISTIDFSAINFDFDEIANSLEQSSGVNLATLGTKIYFSAGQISDSARSSFGKFPNNIVVG